MTTLVTLVLAALFLSAVMAAAWELQRRTGNSGWADVFWSFGLGIAGAGTAIAPIASSNGGRQALVAVVALAWGVRLGSHIAGRTRGGREDGRYANFRKEWGDDFQRRLFWFLQAQAAAALVFVVPIFVAAHRPGDGLRLLDGLGASIIVIAIIGEAIADRQLARFAHDPSNKGRVCDIGLWAWSRHPNYFFEWIGWFAYVVIALDLSGNWPWGWLAWIGPVAMYWLLVHVSGVPPLEEHMLRSRGDAFRRYQAKTSRFFLLPPKV